MFVAPYIHHLMWAFVIFHHHVNTWAAKVMTTIVAQAIAVEIESTDARVQGV